MQIAQSTLGDKEVIHVDKCVGPKGAPGSWETWGHWVPQDRTRQTTFFRFFLLPFASRLLGLLSIKKTLWGLVSCGTDLESQALGILGSLLLRIAEK